jgi:5' nucleotidase family
VNTSPTQQNPNSFFYVCIVQATEGEQNAVDAGKSVSGSQIMSKQKFDEAREDPGNQRTTSEHDRSAARSSGSGARNSDAKSIGGNQKERRSWTSYFDYIVVDANKPRFFMEGNTLREVDTVCSSRYLIVAPHLVSGEAFPVFMETC